MEIKDENKFARFVKKFGLAIGVSVLTFAVVLAVVATSLSEGSVPTSTSALSFGLPMTDCTIVTEYSDELPIKNLTTGFYKCHMGLDISSSDGSVYSVLGGTVSSVSVDEFDGTTIEITHDDGFVSVYGSLDENTKVSVGDTVCKGDLIGEASSSLESELSLGNHIHFELLKDGENVDPSNYLDLENK